jgi:hypothetical protein
MEMGHFFLADAHEIVIGIIAGFAVLAIQRWSGIYAKQSHARSQKALKQEYDDVLYYSVHPEHLTNKLLIRCLGTLIYACYLLLIIKIDLGPEAKQAWLRFLLPMLYASVWPLLASLESLLLIIATIFIVRMGIQSFFLISRLQNVQSYIESVPSNIRNRRNEHIVLAVLADRPTSPISYARMQELKKALDELEASQKKAQAPPDPTPPPSSTADEKPSA